MNFPPVAGINAVVGELDEVEVIEWDCCVPSVGQSVVTPNVPNVSLTEVSRTQLAPVPNDELVDASRGRPALVSVTTAADHDYGAATRRLWMRHLQSM